MDDNKRILQMIRGDTEAAAVHPASAIHPQKGAPLAAILAPPKSAQPVVIATVAEHSNPFAL
jgi:hypothetical protein